MIKSMTGFGRAIAESADYKISVEVKSLNSKGFDLNVRLPMELNGRELELRKLVSEEMVRGKVALFIEVIPLSINNKNGLYNQALFVHYYNELKKLATLVNADSTDIFKLALQTPEVVQADKTDFSETIWKEIVKTTTTAINACEDFRSQEGNNLSIKLSEYIKKIDQNLKEVETLDPERIIKVRNKMRDHLGELQDLTIDEGRFEQEIIFYIEKIDINEEKVRLKNHLNYFLSVLKEGGAVGKKLGFISQEIGREINTIGSKANDSSIQHVVVKMKEELEKIKEQVLNLL